MKHFLRILTFFLLCTAGFAQNHMPYQAVVRDANGELISEQAVTLNFTIRHDGGAESGTVATSTNKQGLVSTYFDVSDTIVWRGAMLKVDVVHNNTTVPGIFVPIAPIPYALFAEVAETVDLTEIENDIQQLQGDITTIQGDIATNATEIAENATDIDDLNSTISQMQAQMTASEQQIRQELTQEMQSRFHLLRDSIQMLRDSMRLCCNNAEHPEIEDVNLLGFNDQYDGAAHSLTITGTQPGDLVIYIVDGLPTFTPPSRDEVGTTHVDVIISRDGDRNWRGSADIIVTMPTIQSSDIQVGVTQTTACDDESSVEVLAPLNDGSNDLYEYALQPDGDANAPTFQTSATFANLTAGDYTLTVRFIAYPEVFATTTVEVAVNLPKTGDTTATACSEFTWYGTTYTTSGEPTHTFTAANGCDSVVTLHLTIGVPAVDFCNDNKIGQVLVKTVSNTDKIELFDGATLKKTLTAPTANTDLVLPKELPNGNYTAIASDNNGCTTTYVVNVNRVATACTVTNINSNEAGSGDQLTGVKDHEDNWYDVVQIGDQCWMRENMRATTNRDGINILECPAGSTYSYSGQKAYKYADSDINFAKYGILYNWNAAVDTFDHTLGIASNSMSSSDAVDAPFSGNRQGICPDGWHVPTDAEWSTLTDSYTGEAGKLVSGCDWYSSSNGNNPGNYSYSDRNVTLFSVLPSGFRRSSFYSLGDRAYFWSATQSSSNNAYSRHFSCGNAEVYRTLDGKYYAFSVRCVRDEVVKHFHSNKGAS